MPYKKVYYTFKCPKCNTEYQVLPQAYFRKIKDEKYGSLCVSCRAKVLWEEMSQEQKDEMSRKAHEGSSNKYNSMSEEEKEKMKEKRKEGVKKYWENLTDEERKDKSEKRSKDRKDFIQSRTEEEWKTIGKNISIAKKKLYKEMNPRERQQMRDTKSKFMKNRWKNLSEEEKNRIMDILRNNSKEYWENITDEELKHRSEIQTERNNKFWNSNSEKVKKLKEKLAKNNREYFNSLSDEEKKRRTEYRISKYREYLNNLTDEEYQKWRDDASKRGKRFWKNLSNEELTLLLKKMFKGNKDNKSNNRFEKQFSESIISNSFYYIREEVLHNNGYHHSWDYGIYDKDNNLVMVVDLDGAYFHADECDYDGIHSKEEYDERRSLSVPNKIKICIIQELNFKKCFEQMIKDLLVDYNDYIDNIFKNMRLIPFPTPCYSDKELIKSYNKLCRMKTDDDLHRDISLNTRIGDRIMNHFHSSIWSANRKGEISPYKAWYNDELLMKCIKNRIIYQNHLNPNKILQGFNISKIAPKVSVFSAGRAKMLINRYLSEYNEIFDPFSGFSGRLLGTISLNKNYIGSDISLIHVRESNDMIKFLRSTGLNINAEIECRDILTSYGTYDCLFTCPPYSDKEQWLEVPVDIRSCDDWIDICLSHFKCKRYLFVVDYTEKYKEHIVDIIHNKSHMNMNSEYVILIEK